MQIRLSKSSIDSFNRCPRCFYLEKNHKIKAPEGIRAGVPMGIDRVIKGHYDSHRASKTVPPELSGQIPGGLYPGDRISMADLRNWRKGLMVKVGIHDLSTAMDDLLYNAKTGFYNVIDAKSKAKLTDVADTEKYYQTQADAYDLALNANGYKTDGDCYFAYYSPVEVVSGPGGYVPFKWNCQVIKIKADHARIKDNTIRAAKCLESSTAPKSSVDCEQCQYVNLRNRYRETFELAKSF